MWRLGWRFGSGAMLAAMISPYTRHVVSGIGFSHYSLLKMTETLLRLPYLGAAAYRSTNDLCVPFGLCPGRPAARIGAQATRLRR